MTLLFLTFEKVDADGEGFETSSGGLGESEIEQA